MSRFTVLNFQSILFYSCSVTSRPGLWATDVLVDQGSGAAQGFSRQLNMSVV